jgi:hypothetical protein
MERIAIPGVFTPYGRKKEVEKPAHRCSNLPQTIKAHLTAEVQ